MTGYRPFGYQESRLRQPAFLLVLLRGGPGRREHRCARRLPARRNTPARLPPFTGPFRILTPVWVLCITLLLSSCGETRREAVQLGGATMGTRYHITWLDGEGQPSPEAVHAGVEEILEAVNASMSTYREDSEISRFNRADVNQWFPVSRAFAEVFAMARDVSQASGGAYDVSVAPLVDLWGFGPAMGETVPAPEAIAAAMQRVGQSRLDFDPDRPALRKPGPMALDFSSIAKGYGVDRIAEWLQTQGIVDYLVEIGGEIRVSGVNPQGRSWRIAVERPEPMQRAAMAAVTLTDAAIATSGDYRNFFEVDGVRYSHTIDPRGGAPVRHELVSVTVVHPSAALADAWATALTVLGPEAAYKLARERNLAAYLIRRETDDFIAVSTPAMEPLLGME